MDFHGLFLKDFIWNEELQRQRVIKLTLPSAGSLLRGLQDQAKARSFIQISYMGGKSSITGANFQYFPRTLAGIWI